MSEWEKIKEKCSFENDELIQVSMVDDYVKDLEQQKKADLKLLSEWLMSLGFSTGHGDTVKDLISEADWQIKELNKQPADATDAIKFLAEQENLLRHNILDMQLDHANSIIERNSKIAELERELADAIEARNKMEIALERESFEHCQTHNERVAEEALKIEEIEKNDKLVEKVAELEQKLHQSRVNELEIDMISKQDFEIAKKKIAELEQKVKAWEMHSDLLEQQLAAEREARIRYENKLFAIGAMSEPPCFVCGYNGEGYFNTQKHSCAERHHRNQSTKQAHSAGDENVKSNY